MDAQAATAYVCEYIQRWCADLISLRNARPSVSTTDVAVTLVLLASGRGPARVPTCEHILRYLPLTDESGAAKFRPLLLRTLSLFGPGELRALRVMSPKCFDVIIPELDRPDDSGAARLTQALSSLRVVAWGGSGTGLKLAFDFIEWHGAALTDLDCNFWSRDNPAANRALARCARLESLSNAQSYNAKVWLGLTHLHTLRGVDLGVVSVAAIAAALPRLHTLEAFINVASEPPVPHTAVAGFFEDLVPRLQALHFHGPWPADDQAPDRAATAVIVPQPLPLLQELIFRCLTVPPVERGFMGAQPAMLEMSHAAITDMLVTARLMGGEATYRPLARVRDLCLTSDGDNPHSSDVARLLCAAPQLRKLNVESLPDLLNDPAFTGLVLPWLRSIRILGGTKHAYSGVQLRRLHFPRLQQLIVHSMHHLVHDE